MTCRRTNHHNIHVRGDYLKQELQNKLIEYRLYIDRFGEDMPEGRDWKWEISPLSGMETPR